MRFYHKRNYWTLIAEKKPDQIKTRWQNKIEYLLVILNRAPLQAIDRIRRYCVWSEINFNQHEFQLRKNLGQYHWDKLYKYFIHITEKVETLKYS